MTDRERRYGLLRTRAPVPPVDWTAVEQGAANTGTGDWREDLYHLLTDEATDPVGDILKSAPGQAVIGGLTSAPAQAVFGALDAPSRFLVREPIGQAVNVLQGEGLGPIGAGQAEWDESVMGLREADLGPLGILKTPLELGLNVAADPLTYTGFGLAGRAAKGLSTVSAVETAAGRPLMAGVAKGAELGLRGLQAYNDAPGRFLLPPVQRGVTKAREGIQRVKPTLFDPAPETTDMILDDVLEQANLEEKSARAPDPLTPTQPTIQPITSTPYAPTPNHPHPRGSAPSVIYGRAEGAWSRLWSRFTGRNTPLGILPGTEESPLFTGGGRTGFLDETITRYADPVAAGEALDDPMLNDMATVGVAIMQNVTDAGGLFPSLQRASTGTRKVREALVERYGRGIEPYIPAIYSRMREQLGDQADALMPASRYLLSWGWSEEMVGTKRLTKANERIAKRLATPNRADQKRIAAIGQEAFAQEVRRKELGTMAGNIGASPEVVEAAAAQGAGMLSLFRSSPDTTFQQLFTKDGAYFPQTIPGQPNQYAGIPEQFVKDLWEGGEGSPLQFDLSEAGKLWGVAQPFGSTREAWNSYMRTTFGELADDELDTLAAISADQLYHTYVNAANVVSGGGAGPKKIATAFAKRGELRPSDFKGDATRKIGAYPGAAADIGSEQSQARIKYLEGLGEASPLMGRFNKKTGKLHAEALTEQGITPQNPTGGIVPNLAGLQDAYRVGENLVISPNGNLAKDWYDNGAREIAAVVGLGNYEDAYMLLNANAITSAATDVKTNMVRALRVLSEWKFSKSDELQDLFGIDGPQLSEAISKSLLEPDLMEGQNKLARRLFDQFISFREDVGQFRTNLQGGPKTHNFAGSFLVNIWRDQMDLALKNAPDNAILKQARQDFEDALTIFTVDRHMARVDNLGNAVTDMESYLLRERGVLGAKATGVSGEEFQSGLWFWVRDRQGFTHILSGESDLATTLRGVVERTWDEDALPTQEFGTLVSRLSDEYGFDERDAVDATYDLVNQLLMGRLMAKSFAEAERVGRRNAGKKAYDPLLHNPLAKAGFPTTMDEFQKDTMGIIQRGASGLAPSEWKQPLGAVEVNSLHEAYQAGLADAVSGRAVVLGFDGARWGPVADPSGAVPIRTGGTFDPTRNIGARKALEKLITNAEISDAFDPTVQYGAEAKLGIGIISEGEKARPALFLLDADPAAITPPEGASITSLLDAVAGPREQRPGFAADTLRRRKATLAELDTVNPWSIFQRKVVRPIMARYTRDSLREGTEVLTGKGMGDLDLADWPEQAAGAFEGKLGNSPHFNPGLSLNSRRALQTELKDGTTYGNYLSRESRDAAADMETVRAAGVTWDAFAPLNKKLEAIGNNPEVEKIVKKWDAEKRDPLHSTDPDAVARDRLARQRAKDQGREYGRSTKWDMLRGAWSEITLTSGKYLTGNMVGDTLALAASGTRPTFGYREYLTALKAVRSGSEVITRAEVASSLGFNKIAQQWGLKAAPGYVIRSSVNDIALTGGKYDTTYTGEIIGRITKNAGLARKAGSPIRWVNEVAKATGGVARGTKWADAFDTRMREYMVGWEGEVNRRGADIPGFEFSVLQNINAPGPGGMFYENLREHLTDLGLPENQAKNLAEAYGAVRNKALAEAKREVDRTLFSYEKTNLDKYFGAVAPFTYWYSRAMRFWWETALEHPALMLNYMRMSDGIEDAENDPGLSARQKGFIKVMGTSLGFSLLMNPDAIFGVVKAFNMDNSYEPDGQTSLGGAIQWMKDKGLGLYPWIDGTINLMGIYGNTFEPDLLGIRHRSLVGAAVHFVRAHAGWEPAGAPYADAMGQARYAVSSFVDSLTPDWFAQTVTPKPGNSSQEAALDTIIENVIIANNPNLTNQQLADIMVDPYHPEYNRAYEQASSAGLIQQLLSIALPGQFKMRHDARDVKTAQVDLIREEAKKKGVAPFRFTPTPGDLAFAAKYQAMTGNAWKPTDYMDAKAKLDLARAPVEAKPFIVQEQAFNQIGGESRTFYDQYQAIRNGEDDLTKMEPDPAVREEMAQRWLDAHPKARRAVEDITVQRQAYRAEHAEFEQFKQWQGQMYQLSTQLGGLGEYRRRAIAQNPNFARYWARTEVYIQQHFPQDEWEGKYEEYTKNAAAFLAIHGISEYRSTQGPVPGVPPVDVTLPGFATEQGYGPSKPDWVQTLQNMGAQSARDVLV